MRYTVIDARGDHSSTMDVEDDHALVTVLRDGVPVGALDLEADGTVTWGVFDPEGEWVSEG